MQFWVLLGSCWLCAALSEPLAQSLSPSWYKTDHPCLATDTFPVSLTLSFPFFSLSFLLLIIVHLPNYDGYSEEECLVLHRRLSGFIYPSPFIIFTSIFPFLLFPSSLLLVNLILSVCLPGGVRWSDRACGVQQQRSEDQLHPADLGETPRRPQRGQESPVIMRQSGHIAHRLWVSYRSLIWFHNAGGGV